MLKKTVRTTLILAITLFSFTSCYTYSTTVGNGAQGAQETTTWNHYFIYGLAPGNVSNPSNLANGAKDYTVNTRISFVNGLVGALTFGIYTPTTTTIVK